jgi:hypothetical protein
VAEFSSEPPRSFAPDQAARQPIAGGGKIAERQNDVSHGSPLFRGSVTRPHPGAPSIRTPALVGGPSESISAMNGFPCMPKNISGKGMSRRFLICRAC